MTEQDELLARAKELAKLKNENEVYRDIIYAAALLEPEKVSAASLREKLVDMRNELTVLREQLAERDAEIERLRPTDRQLEAVGRLAAWVRDFGHAKEPAFIADVVMLIEAIKGDE